MWRIAFALLVACGRIDFDPRVDAAVDVPLDAYVCAAPYAITSGGCYRVVSTPQPWLTAEQQCEADGAHLINVADVAEHFVLHGLLGDAGLVQGWIGYTDRKTEGMFQWITPGGVDPASNTCFLGSNPNTAANDCVAQAGTNGCPDWAILDCNQGLPFVCEHDAFLADPSTY